MPVTPMAMIAAWPKFSIDIVFWLFTAASSQAPMVLL